MQTTHIISSLSNANRVAIALDEAVPQDLENYVNELIDRQLPSFEPGEFHIEGNVLYLRADYAKTVSKEEVEIILASAKEAIDDRINEAVALQRTLASNLGLEIEES